MTKCKECGKEVDEVDEEGLCFECSLYSGNDYEWGEFSDD